MQSKFQIIVIDLYPIELVHFIFYFYFKKTTGLNNYVYLHCDFEKVPSSVCVHCENETT